MEADGLDGDRQRDRQRAQRLPAVPAARGGGAACLRQLLKGLVEVVEDVVTVGRRSDPREQHAGDAWGAGGHDASPVRTFAPDQRLSSNSRDRVSAA